MSKLKYMIEVEVDVSAATVAIQCDSINFVSQANLQKETIGHILTSPIKLIVSEIKNAIKAMEESHE